MIFSIYVPLCLILLLIFLPIVKGIWGRNKAYLFNPLVFASIVYFYYIIVSVFKLDSNELSSDPGISMLLWGCCAFMLSYSIAFKFKVSDNFFKKVNRSYLRHDNLFSRGVLLFLIGFIAYASIKGFTFNIVRTQQYADFDPNASYGQTSAYLTCLISLCPTAICLIYASGRSRWVMYTMIVLYTFSAIFSGSRFLIALLLLMFGTFYHLYPHVKRPRWIIVFAIAVIFYISMGIIEFTRNYGSGLDIDKLEYLEGDQIREGAIEGMGVFEFSADVMEVYQPEDFIHFEPVVNALLLPFPRQIFKNKPKGYYMREANIKVYGDITKGAAFLNFTEAYISFGWLGIILYGLLFGLFAKIIWVNYLRHPSLGAILLLASFNAWIYVFISRGYMAQAYLNYFYYVIIPFWIVWIVDRFTKTDRFNNGIS